MSTKASPGERSGGQLRPALLWPAGGEGGTGRTAGQQGVSNHTEAPEGISSKWPNSRPDLATSQEGRGL